MTGRVLAIVFIIIALIMALLVTFWPQQQMETIVKVTRFFDVMLPVLAVAALVKYICCGHKRNP
jgi:hypothetical protein